MVVHTLSANVGPLGRIWRSYEHQLQRRPVLTQMTTSGLLWGLGDVFGQRLGEPQKKGIDVRRTALTAAFGGLYIGPVGHLWYSNLDRLCARFGAANSMQFLLAKVLADNFAFGSVYIATFFAFSSMVIDQAGLGDFQARMQTEFVPTMLAELAVWPPYMAFVFSKVPVHHQLLACNFLTLLDVAFLSYISSQEDWPESLAAALKRNHSQHTPRIFQNFTDALSRGGGGSGSGDVSASLVSQSEELDLAETMALSNSGLGVGFWGSRSKDVDVSCLTEGSVSEGRGQPTLKSNKSADKGKLGATQQLSRGEARRLQRQKQRQDRVSLAASMCEHRV